MKQIFICLIATFLLSICTSLNAQNVYLAPELGVNLIPTESSDLGQNYQLGLNGGLRFEYHFSKRFQLISGVYISQKKQLFDSTGTASLLDDFAQIFELLGGFGGFEGLLENVNLDINQQYNGQITQNFIELPLMASVQIGDFNIMAGPYAAFQLNATTTTTIQSNIPFLTSVNLADLDPTGLISVLLPPAEESETIISKVDSGYQPLDYGIKGGLGFVKENVGFNLLYTYGLPDFRIDPTDNDVKNHQYIEFSTFYRFGLPERVKMPKE